MTSPSIAQQIEKLGSDLERAFDTQFLRLGHDLPEPEVFYKPFTGRGYHFDRSWPTMKIGIELQGGTHGYPIICHNCNVRVRGIKSDGTPGKEIRIPGHHARRSQLTSDMEKINLAQLNGWAVLLFGHDDVHANPFQMVDQIRRLIEKRRYLAHPHLDLTARELEILTYVAGGFTGREIAIRVDCKVNTVKSHVATIVTKLNAVNRTSAVATAASLGLIDWEKVTWAVQIEPL